MVGVIIPNWNGKIFLKTCLESLEKQTFGDFEIIFVDNGSSDGSQDYIKNYFPEIKIIQLDKNYGLGVAINVGIKESLKNKKIKNIALLNNDIRADSRWLEELVKNADIFENRKVGIFASKILFMDDPKIIFSAGQDFKNGHLQEKGLGEKDNGQFDNKFDIIGACCAACLYRRKMLEEIGLYREEFFHYGVDAELGWRAKKNGWGAKFVPSSIAYHKGNLYLIRKKDEKIDREFAIFDLKNLIWMEKKYGSFKNKILLSLSLSQGIIFHWLKIHKIKPDWKIKLNYKSIINLWSKNENWLI